MDKNPNPHINEDSLNLEKLSFSDDNTKVIEISLCQFNSIKSVLKIVDKLQQENELLKHRISNLMFVISVYGLVFPDEVFSKLRENGFVTGNDFGCD